MNFVKNPFLIPRIAAAHRVVPSGPDPVSSGAAVSSTSSPGGAGTHTLSSYAVPSVTNGILIVGAIAEDFLNIPSLTGVTFGGSAMTAMASPVLHNPQSDFQIETGLYYVLNPSGTGDIVVSGSASSGDLNRMGLIVLTVANVKQSAPTLISNTSAGATSISTTLNSVPDKALVVDMFWARTDGVVASETRQNVNDNEVITGGLRHYGGSDDLNETGSAENVTFGWQQDTGTTNWLTHMMVALEKYV